MIRLYLVIKGYYMIKYVLILSLLLSGCTTRNELGRCVGLADDKEANLVYELSYWNLFLAVFFSQTVVVPIVVVAKDLECPVKIKK